MNVTKLVAPALGALVVPVASAEVTLSLLSLPEGNSIIQASGAIAGNTGGGVASSDTRTAYVFAPDFGDPEPNLADFSGTTWPYIYVSATATVSDLVIDGDITADIQLLTNPSSPAGLQWILVNGNPIYQFINDNQPSDANGNFGPWNYLEADSTPTQSRVPAPGAVGVLGLAGLAAARRRRAER